MQLTDSFYKTVLDSLYDGVYFVDEDRRIVYWNKAAERLTGYTASEVLGRCCAENLLNHVDGRGDVLCTGHCPLSHTMSDGMARQADVFLRHKDGHRVPVQVRVAPWHDESGEIRGAVEVFSGNATREVHGQPERVCPEQSLTCAQTRVPSRQFLEQKLISRLDELRRCAWPFAVLLIDLDRFTEFNRIYGKRIGDELLLIVARTLAGSIPARDVLGRWESDKFLAILTGVYPGRLKAVAERCRALVERSCRVSGETPFSVTVSVGATFACEDDTVVSLIARLESLVAAGKDAGRNCVSLDEGIPEPSAHD